MDRGPVSDETAIDIEFAGEVRHFFLPMPRILEIERICGNKSHVTMYEELCEGMGLDRETEAPRFLGIGPVRIQDVYEIIRCAAIGGGMAPNDAGALVREYVDGRPLAETAPVAWAILDRAVMGVRLKKKVDDEQGQPNHFERVSS